MTKRKYNQNGGFTLVELIVVMAIIVILSAVAIPSMVGFISNAKESEVLTECKIAVVTAQSLYIENYNTPDTVTSDMVLEDALIDGAVVEMHQSNSILTYLEYSKDGYTCIYSKDPDNESGVDDVYTVIKEGSAVSDTGNNTSENASNNVSESETSESNTSTVVDNNTVDYFYVYDIDDTYKVRTQGDLATYDFGPYGKSITTGWVFYYNGDYYITRDNQYLKSDSNIVSYLQNYGMKINFSNGITVPSPSSTAGDIKLKNRKLYVFFPRSGDNYENYYDESRWVKIKPSPKTLD